MDNLVIALILIVPLLVCVAIFFGAPARMASLLGSAFCLILSFIICLYFYLQDDKSLSIVAHYPILSNPKMSFSFGADGVTAVLLFMSALVSFGAVWIVPTNFPKIKWRYICITLISAGAFGSLVSKDMLLYFAFHELALIPTFIMIGGFGYGNKKSAAWISVLFLAIGSLFILVGIILMMNSYGVNSINFVDILKLKDSGNLPSLESQKWIFLIFIIGFGAITAIFPFHGWIIPLYKSAPTSIVMIHASVMKCVGIYGMIRYVFPLLPDGAQYWQNLLIVLVLGNILFMGITALSRRTLDEIIAYASIIHIGYIYLGLLTGNKYGETGALFLLFSSGISVAMTFSLTGWLRRNLGGLEMDFFGGLGKKIPRTMFLFGFGVFALIGFPGIASFIGDSLIFIGIFENYRNSNSITILHIAGIGAIWGTVLMSVLMLRAFHKIFMGEESKEVNEIKDMSFSELSPYLLFVIVLLLLGFAPKLILNLLLL